MAVLLPHAGGRNAAALAQLASASGTPLTGESITAAHLSCVRQEHGLKRNAPCSLAGNGAGTVR